MAKKKYKSQINIRCSSSSRSGFILADNNYNFPGVANGLVPFEDIVQHIADLLDVEIIITNRKPTGYTKAGVVDLGKTK